MTPDTLAKGLPFHIIWYAPWLTTLLSLVVPIGSITLGPLIITSYPNLKEHQSAYQHELIHIKQYYETLVIGFLLIYLWEFLHGFILYRAKEKAYNRIRFEQEAFNHAHEANYLAERSSYAWLDYQI